MRRASAGGGRPARRAARWFRRTGPSFLVLLLALLSPGSAPADEPPASPPPGARFETRRLDFPAARLAFPTGRVVWPQARLAEPKSAGRDELRFDLAADVLFDFDRADLRPEAEAVLADLAAQVKTELRRPRLEVEGHTDSRGSDEYNQKLSERRAEAVRTWLLRKAGFPAASVSARGFGERRPVAANERPDGSDDPIGRQKNRRVEILARSGR
ncbi:MAG: hypothetical protein KatS3mg117_1317 [Geminicoccaceae bacterium]|nr:MAG: hypothetical protein KatS3mg117_1317 [Geminicoccaceae bacterium]